jgi:hypothetical protein
VISLLHDIARAWDVAWWWFEHATGTDQPLPTGPEYGAFSGWVSDLGLLAIVGGIITLAKHHNCHVHRCWRIARHTFTDENSIEVRVCKRCHPNIDHKHKLTREDLKGSHAAKLRAAADELLRIHDEVKAKGTI